MDYDSIKTGELYLKLYYNISNMIEEFIIKNQY